MSEASLHSPPVVLRAEDLTKRYRKRAVVQHASLQVEEGEIVGLLGPNGAGKTTTFYMIVGMIRPDSGEIYLGDDRITRQPMYRDRKSTRLNSSHVAISYAVLCLKR